MNKRASSSGMSDDVSDVFAVIVSSSKYFHNFRHASNALAVYSTMRRLGVPDSHITLMLAGAVPCDVRSVLAGSVFNSAARTLDLYPADVRPAYRGDDVTVENLLGVLTDRLPFRTPASRRLQSGPNSRVVIYLTGHGGDEFLKFSDHFELTAEELAEAARAMFAHRRCAELLLVVDTCQAATLTDWVAATALPGEPAMRVISLASSALGENSYSFDLDRTLGVALSDRSTCQNPT